MEKKSGLILRDAEQIQDQLQERGMLNPGDAFLQKCRAYISTDAGFPKCGDTSFWMTFNKAYLTKDRRTLVSARAYAVHDLRHRRPGAVPPSIAQCRRYVRCLPQQLVAAARGENSVEEIY